MPTVPRLARRRVARSQSTVSQPDQRNVNPSGGPLLPRVVNAILLRRGVLRCRGGGPPRHRSGRRDRLSGRHRARVGRSLPARARASRRGAWCSSSSSSSRSSAGSSTPRSCTRSRARIAGAAVEYKRLLRCLGFAETPAMLSMVGFAVDEPLLPWVQFGVGAWLLAATIVAVRSAARVSTGRAVAIGIARLRRLPRAWGSRSTSSRTCRTRRHPRRRHLDPRRRAVRQSPFLRQRHARETAGWQTRRSPPSRRPNARSCPSWRSASART